MKRHTKSYGEFLNESSAGSISDYYKKLTMNRLFEYGIKPTAMMRGKGWKYSSTDTVDMVPAVCFYKEFPVSEAVIDITPFGPTAENKQNDDGSVTVFARVKFDGDEIAGIWDSVNITPFDVEDFVEVHPSYRERCAIYHKLQSLAESAVRAFDEDLKKLIKQYIADDPTGEDLGPFGGVEGLSDLEEYFEGDLSWIEREAEIIKKMAHGRDMFGV